MSVTRFKFAIKVYITFSIAKSLKLCTPNYHDRMSFVELHRINKRATPQQMCDYKHVLQLHKLINLEIPKVDWVDLNFQQVFSVRSRTFNFTRTNNYRVGLNLICNRLHSINGKLDYSWIEESLESFKL